MTETGNHLSVTREASKSAGWRKNNFPSVSENRRRKRGVVAGVIGGLASLVGLAVYLTREKPSLPDAALPPLSSLVEHAPKTLAGESAVRGDWTKISAPIAAPVSRISATYPTNIPRIGINATNGMIDVEAFVKEQGGRFSTNAMHMLVLACKVHNNAQELFNKFLNPHLYQDPNESFLPEARMLAEKGGEYASACFGIPEEKVAGWARPAGNSVFGEGHDALIRVITLEQALDPRNFEPAAVTTEALAEGEVVATPQQRVQIAARDLSRIKRDLGDICRQLNLVVSGCIQDGDAPASGIPPWFAVAPRTHRTRTE